MRPFPAALEELARLRYYLPLCEQFDRANNIPPGNATRALRGVAERIADLECQRAAPGHVMDDGYLLSETHVKVCRPTAVKEAGL